MAKKKKKWVFDPKGKTFERRPSATEDAKRRFYEEYFGKPKPARDPDAMRELALLLGRELPDDETNE